MRLDVPRLEKEIGIEVYITDTDGIDGRMRKRVSDFVVEELLPNKQNVRALINNPPKGNTGNFTHFIIKKVNWATIEAIKAIARRLKVSYKRFSYAGIKDKRAIAFQRLSIWKVFPKDLESRPVKNIEVLAAWRERLPVKIGELWGNRFKIKVRNVSEGANSLITKTKEQLDCFGGFPNFFGHQRFGVHRPITHIIGKYMIQGDYENAIKEFLSKVFPLEGEDAKIARNTLAETWNYNKVIHLFPDRLKTEKRIINYLINHKDDFKGAFESLPSSIQKIFIHGYQSFIFNKSLSYRIKKKMFNVMPGDVLLQTNEYGIPIKYPYVATEKNIEKVTEAVKKRRLVLAGPVIGYKSIIPENTWGDYIKSVLKKESITKERFKEIEFREIDARGTYRPLFLPVEWENIEKIKEDEEIVYKFTFSLQRAAYATIVMREFMKTEATAYV